MDASATSTNGKSEAPVWKHGPQGELAIGTVEWTRFRALILVFGLPSVLLLYFAFGWGTFLVFCGSVLAATRLSRFSGTPSLVEALTAHFGLLYALVSAALIGLQILASNNPGTSLDLAYALGAFAFIYVVATHNVKKLLAWEASGSIAPSSEASLDDLKAMREEIVWSQASLSSLPVFDDKRPELVTAWEESDPPRIAHFLQEANLETQESWKRANEMLNRALSYTDRARRKLNSLLTQTEQGLAPFGIDYQSIEVERSKQSHVEATAAIPKNLTVQRIDAQNLAFIQGGGRAIAQGATGQLPPLAAVAAIGISVVAHYAYKSRTLRRLKEAQGQLQVNAEAARGDFGMLNSLFSTRIIPNLDDMIRIVSRLEDGLSDLNPEGVDPTNPQQREKATRLAFAIVEGRKLVSTMAGD